MHYMVSFVGYCPRIDDERQISVELAELNMSGTQSKQYKKVGFHCPDADDCQHLGASGYCSLCVSAPCRP